MSKPATTCLGALLAALLAACGPGHISGAAAGVATPTFAPLAGGVVAGTIVTVSCATAGATVYTGQTNPPQTAAATFTVGAAGTWYAQARLDGRASAVASATYTVVTSPPAAPSGLSAGAASSTAIALAWADNSSDEAAFALERAPDAGGSPGAFAPLATVGADVTAYSDGGLAPSTTYWYRVRATNAAGSSAYSNTAHAATLAGGGGALAFVTAGCPPATQGQAYTCTLAATGGTPPYTYSVVSAAGFVPLPEGMALSASTGVVSSAHVGGQGSYGVRLRVRDAAAATDDLDLTFGVAGSNAFLGSIFPADSIFHHRVDAASTGLPVDTSPAAPIYSAYQPASLKVFFGSAAYEGAPQGIPAISVPADQALVPVATTVYQDYFTSGPIPPYAPVEGTSASGGDMHVLVYRQAGTGSPPALYELWQGIFLGAAGWTDSSNALWPDVSGDALTPQEGGTADAAGLPIAPLLLNADEVIGAGTPSAPSGAVRHPVRFTVTHMLNYWVWPATETAGTGSCTKGGATIPTASLISQSSPPTSCTMTGPAGEIYRLKASVPDPACVATSPQAKIILQGLRDYGIILADNGMSGGLIGTPDTRWDDDDLHCLTQLTLAAFEPVNVSTLMKDPASGATAR